MPNIDSNEVTKLDQTFIPHVVRNHGPISVLSPQILAVSGNLSELEPVPRMFTTTLITLALAATGLSQAPEGYRTVYITSAQDTKFVVVPKTRTAGATLVV
jgi:hypothetical protein